MKPAAWHKHVARLLYATGGNRRAVAAATGKTVAQIDAICEKPAVAEYRRQLEDSALMLRVSSMGQLDDMLRQALAVIEAILNDPSAPASVRLRAAETVLDRHPSGMLQKRSRVTTVSGEEHHPYDSRSIEAIKRDALEGDTHHAE